MHLLFCAYLINIFPFLTGVELRYFFPSEMLRECLVCVICNSNSIHFFYIQTLHNDCSHIENVHLLFYAHFIDIYFSFLWGLELRHFLLETLRWFLVCVICNSKSFYSLIFKLCIMIVHTLNMYLPFLCKFDKHFLIFRAF